MIQASRSFALFVDAARFLIRPIGHLLPRGEKATTADRPVRGERLRLGRPALDALPTPRTGAHHDRHHRRPRARDPRQPGQSDRGGGRAAGERRAGPRRRAVGRLDRQARGGGAARRGRPLPRQGRAQGHRRGERRYLRRGVGLRGRGAGEDRRHHDRARRHAQQGAAWRQRHSRGQPRGRPRGGPRAAPAALPLRGRGGSPHAARADDEHRQWRRARRQPDRLSGVHGHARGRRHAVGGRAHGLGDLSHAEEGAGEGGPQHECRRRGRLRAEHRLRARSP